jgi:hypothetical protein
MDTATGLLEMPAKKPSGKKPRADRQEAGVSEGGDEKNYGTGVVKITPELAFKLKLVAEFRGVSIADLLEPHLRPLVESMYSVMLKDAEKLK